MKNVEISQFYETLLCTPGMSETVRVDLRISRKSILLLTQILDQGLSHKPTSDEGLGHLAGPEAVGELREMLKLCLEKSMLTELYDKLGILQKN